MEPRHNYHVLPDTTFRYTLFDIVDVEYNLDYTDSNGDRYSQELAAYRFDDTDVPLLRSSAFNYFPAHTGPKHLHDTLHGQVIGEKPIIGTRRPSKLGHIRQLLASELGKHLGNSSVVTHEQNYLKISNIFTKEILASIYVESFDEDNFIYEVIVPTASKADDSSKDRYDDVTFASELWMVLHGFAANLRSDLDNVTPVELGKLAYTATNPAQTLRIGLERTHDACRTGLFLLDTLVYLQDLQPDKHIQIDKTLDLGEFDAQYLDMDDDSLRAICRRAAVTASKMDKSIITPQLMLASANFQEDILEITSS